MASSTDDSGEVIVLDEALDALGLDGAAATQGEGTNEQAESHDKLLEEDGFVVVTETVRVCSAACCPSCASSSAAASVVTNALSMAQPSRR